MIVLVIRLRSNNCITDTSDRRHVERTMSILNIDTTLIYAVTFCFFKTR
ncbi:hypothetical protein MtrunA17_Chr4g0024131 [Medicago truncatula]|uniref:Uncharacterized protein n=1 Tax=Medicago truncatula TaxID=3880 RepID=A0A396I3V6_MEDTR|nr:hypothetical protein MtrunA17_Chr4g0024131 [Medicago truncatula]